MYAIANVVVSKFHLYGGNLLNFQSRNFTCNIPNELGKLVKL